MKKEKLQQAIFHLEEFLQNFKTAKERGKETNSNKERAQSIADIEQIAERLEIYMRNNEELLEQMTGTEIELAREIEWSDIIRPSHFEEDLQGEIDKLKEKTS